MYILHRLVRRQKRSKRTAVHNGQVDRDTRQLLYWEVPCQAWGSEMSYCQSGEGCGEASGEGQTGHHPSLTIIQ